MKHWILAVDPGETCGFAWFTYEDLKHVVLTGVWCHTGLPTSEFARYFRDRLYSLGHSKCVVVEDYVIYASAAQLHVGQPLVTPKLIGVIEAVCALENIPIKVALVPAAKKGRWPDARIRNKFPYILPALDSEHQKDAVKLGLAYIEGAADGR